MDLCLYVVITNPMFSRKDVSFHKVATRSKSDGNSLAFPDEAITRFLSSEVNSSRGVALCGV